ncbi:MAG: NAD(P)/FAD-dependent oxidoreductase, partial [Saprospiraceae bacterium]
GLEVLLVDKESFPRDKICGDAIPGPSFKAMDKINPEWGKQMRSFLDKEDVRTAKGIAPNGKSISIDWVTYSYNSKRLDFDNFLMDLVKKETDTTIMENSRLQKVVSDENQVECTFKDGKTITSDIVIACDGANSVVSRQLANFDKKNGSSSVAVRAYFKNIKGMESGVNEFHFFKEFMPGYFWIFPLENGWANVGFGLLQGVKKRNTSTKNLREALTKITQEIPSVAERFQGAELMDNVKGFGLPLAMKKRKLSGNRFMLCGDAGSLIDPLWGHGIDKAMWSGIFAAEEAKRSFSRLDFSADSLVGYDNSLYQKLGPELSRNTKILQLFGMFPFALNPMFVVAQNKWVMKMVGRYL